ncbi:hypothetical protein NM688_g3130 [Phlebia brevispora]|uniref:Uncharacterized protein n=1 Tax=Phlebia brevispora TaxID=194682 RepID=A0ACC1T6U8_9APHY|nr:hypothetical protein NM688_g3130 [Phlebia brevispora]
MSAKRKRSDIEDSDSDEPSLGRQVLPVANLPENFDGVPQDGLQYLFTDDRRDARRLPHVTRAANPYEIKEEPAEALADLQTLSSSHSALPSEDWREIFLIRFRNFKKNCVQPTIHIDVPEYNRRLMPDRKDRDAWWAFLTGRPESEWNPPKKPKAQKYHKAQQCYGRGLRAFADGAEYDTLQYGEIQRAGPSQEDAHMNDEREVEQVITINPAESLPTPSSTPAPDSRVEPANDVEKPPSISTQPEPTPTLMRNIDHRYALHLLMYFAHWISLYLERPVPKTCTISETHARWMFVLLSRVDEYITADEQSTLRSLARGCMGLIKERMQRSVSDVEGSSPSDEPDTVIGMSSCWMVIAAVIDHVSIIAGMSGQPTHGNYHGYYSKRPTSCDPRLAIIPPSVFRGARVLDVGCNEGWVTCQIGAYTLLRDSRSSVEWHLFAKSAQTLGARKVIGVDIDDILVRAAWKRRRSAWSLQAPIDEPESANDRATGEKRKRDTEDQQKVHDTQDYFPASCEHMFGPLPIPSYPSTQDAFPHNVVFRAADWVNNKIVEDAEGYDVVIAYVLSSVRAYLDADGTSFSITKWVHLNDGDAGLRRFFERVYTVLKPGGVFILEPQEWETYGKAKRMDIKLKETAKTLKLRPDGFEAVLVDMGFKAAEHLGKAGEGGFRRPIDLYRKQ